MIFGKDFNLYFHMVGGFGIILLTLFILWELKNKKSKSLTPLAITTAVVSWLTMIPSAITYLIYYPATKTVIKAGSWVWAHSIVMEIKEHIGILIPVIATTAAVLVYRKQLFESKRWWILLLLLTVSMAVMGRVIKMGALK